LIGLQTARLVSKDAEVRLMPEVDEINTTLQSPAHEAPGAGQSGRYDSALSRYLSVVADDNPRRVLDETSAATEKSRDGCWDLETRTVSEVMTRGPVSVPENATFKAIVDTLSAHRISALPVVDSGGRVVGLVSESDLLAKVVTGGDPQPRSDGHHPDVEDVGQVRQAPQRRRKSHGEVACELMSAPAVTVHRDCSIPNAARLAAFAKVHRLPVVDDDARLVGIVTRSDMLRVFMRDDCEIRRHILDLFASQFCIDTTGIDVSVLDGVVRLTGAAGRRSLIQPIVDVILRTVGVVGVHDDVVYTGDAL
jgi:CBS-domain-containing membrane protein